MTNTLWEGIDGWNLSNDNGRENCKDSGSDELHLE